MGAVPFGVMGNGGSAPPPRCQCAKAYFPKNEQCKNCNEKKQGDSRGAATQSSTSNEGTNYVHCENACPSPTGISTSITSTPKEVLKSLLCYHCVPPTWHHSSQAAFLLRREYFLHAGQPTFYTKQLSNY